VADISTPRHGASTEDGAPAFSLVDGSLVHVVRARVRGPAPGPPARHAGLLFCHCGAWCAVSMSSPPPHSLISTQLNLNDRYTPENMFFHCRNCGGKGCRFTVRAACSTCLYVPLCVSCATHPPALYGLCIPCCCWESEANSTPVSVVRACVAMRARHPMSPDG
jgi:hypothetical protein